MQIQGTAEIVEERDRLLEMGKSLFGRHVGNYTDDMLPAVEMMLNKRVGIKVNPVRVPAGTTPSSRPSDPPHGEVGRPDAPACLRRSGQPGASPIGT